MQFVFRDDRDAFVGGRTERTLSERFAELNAGLLIGLGHDGNGGAKFGECHEYFRESDGRSCGVANE